MVRQILKMSSTFVKRFRVWFICNGVVKFAVYQLISRRRFQQIDVLEGQNILVTISGKKNKIRVYYLSWLKARILKTEGVGKNTCSFC